MSIDSFDVRKELPGLPGGPSHYSLAELEQQGRIEIDRLPYSIRVLLEAVLRAEDGRVVTRDHVEAMLRYDPRDPAPADVPFKPARVLFQDFTGVPAVVDLAAMRNAMDRLGGDPARINPQIPVDLVVDHSVQVDHFASEDALERNAELEFRRNRERYEFLHWGQASLERFRAVPPASGICHQVNLEHLGTVVARRTVGGADLVFPDTVVGIDSHTPMIGGLGVLGWGVGGIEAEAALLGQPLFMLAPRVVGVELSGRLAEGVTATDLVLTVTEILRRHDVVGKFVEFFGPGLDGLSVPDRATIANMAPEYGATVGYFPIDDRTIDYLALTGRPAELIDLVGTYATAQRLYRTGASPAPVFSETIALDLGGVVPSLAGPKRPQDRVAVGDLCGSFEEILTRPVTEGGYGKDESGDEGIELPHGSVVIAAITSCTNTSNPSVMVAAGLLAEKAVALGLSSKPWVKTSLAPGSTVVTSYLERTGLLGPLEALGFHVVGYGCTTCIGNSGPLPDHIAAAVKRDDTITAAVLSGNRNFEGRINPLVRASYLASPPLVVAYALAGTVRIDLAREPLGVDRDGNPVTLAQIWPSSAEIESRLGSALDAGTFTDKYDGIEQGNPTWNAVRSSDSALHRWDRDSTYIKEPPFFVGMEREPGQIAAIRDARALLVVGHSLTTDHISPAGAIPADSPAGAYLIGRGVRPEDFNSYGSRRGNDEVMVRGTFANIRLKNLLAPGTSGGLTTHFPSGEVITIFEGAERYRAEGTPLIVIGGRDYGMGSSRDWAAKGPLLLGVRAVIAESFERIHRSNLVGMGVLPLQFKDGESARSLGLAGDETFDVLIDDDPTPGAGIRIVASAADGTSRELEAVLRLDSEIEVDYYRNGGILHTVLREMLSSG